MRSDLINRIEKANRYATEPGRIKIRNLSVDFQGTSANHVTTLTDGKWNCTCHFFANWQTCSHAMALQKVLGEMLPDEVRAAFTV